MAPDRHFRNIGVKLNSLIVEKRGPNKLAEVAESAGVSEERLQAVVKGEKVPNLEFLSDVLIAIGAKPSELFPD